LGVAGTWLIVNFSEDRGRIEAGVDYKKSLQQMGKY